MSCSEEYWRAVCARTMVLQDDTLREALYVNLVEPNLARLRGGNAALWNEVGWYAARDTSLPVLPGTEEFPVPLACIAWHDVEFDQRTGAAFRFFHRRAWLDIAFIEHAGRLAFTVPYMVMREALQRLEVQLFGITQDYSLAPWPDSCGRVTVRLDAATRARAMALGRLEVELLTPVMAIPALAIPGASDRRRLSLAVTYPELLD